MTVPAPTPLAGVGGGGGGLTAEADQLVLADTGNSDTLFLRQYERDVAGAVTGTTDTQLDGTTAYVEVGPSVPYVAPATGLAVSVNRYTNADSPVTIAAGAVNVTVLTIADAVTVEAAAVPAGVAVSFGGVEGHTTAELAVVLDATGEALVVEER